MENYQQQWKDCLALIKEKVKDEHVYDVWFGCIELESYNPEDKSLVVRVPSRYVYEFLEQYGLRLLSWAIKESFKTGVSLSYRIKKESTFMEYVDYLKQQGFNPYPGRQHIAVPDAKKRLENGLKYYLEQQGKQVQWLPAYDQIADWLTDNKGRGLLCVGTSGLGKTFICRSILPVILGRNIPSVSAQDMNKRIDELKSEPCVIIDDLGKEDVEVKNFGNRRTPFFELCDAAEKQGHLLIITTNLSTTPKPDGWSSPWPFPSSIQERYGDAVLSRLKSLVKFVGFSGEDMRR